MEDRNLVELKEIARVRYFEGGFGSLEDLAKMLHLNFNTLRNWVYYGNKDEDAWRKIKKASQDEILKAMIEDSYAKDRQLKDRFTELGFQLADKIAEGLRSGAYAQEEHSKLLNALSKFKTVSDAGLRLDEGRSTSNVEIQHKSHNLHDLAERAKNEDPFTEAVDAERTE